MDKDYDYKDSPLWKNKIIERNRKFYIKNKKYLDVWLFKARKNKRFFKSKSKLEWQCGKFDSEDTLWNMIFISDHQDYG
jgi:hypothetical protein